MEKCITDYLLDCRSSELFECCVNNMSDRGGSIEVRNLWQLIDGELEDVHGDIYT